jgi:hypothetical protein
MEPDVGLDGTKTRYIRALQRYIYPNVINCLRPEPNAEEGGQQISKAEEASRKGTFLALPQACHHPHAPSLLQRINPQPRHPERGPNLELDLADDDIQVHSTKARSNRPKSKAAASNAQTHEDWLRAADRLENGLKVITKRSLLFSVVVVDGCYRCTAETRSRHSGS